MQFYKMPPSPVRMMAVGAILIMYGVFANIYAGRRENDGTTYKPGRSRRVWAIVLGVLLFLFGLYRNR